MSQSPVPVVRLARGKEKSLLRRHPWVFSGAIADEPRRLRLGDTVDLVSADGAFLARAAWSPESQIRARVWTFEEGEQVDAEFFFHRIRKAVMARSDLVRARRSPEDQERGPVVLEGLGIFEWWQTGSDAFRLVHGESDGLPGLVVDRYLHVVVCQLLSAGVERWKDEILDAVWNATGADTVYERSDADVREKEGLPPRVGLARGREPDELVEIHESDRTYLVDVREGHKTGFYLDQRLGRDAACQWVHGEALNAFSYSGGFSVAMLRGGASTVTDVDTSASALALARRNVEANGPSSLQKYDAIEGDVFSVLRKFRDSRRTFDTIVLDPPKFADSKANLEKAARGYKDINLLAFKLLNPGGTLLTFSCSGLMTPELFQKIVADAALDAKREAVIVERLGQPGDHPVALPFPEGAYLKGLVCRVPHDLPRRW
jgi:23S rRNA (cytosine1962-C5)-methyltransferase